MRFDTATIATLAVSAVTMAIPTGSNPGGRVSKEMDRDGSGGKAGLGLDESMSHGPCKNGEGMCMLDAAGIETRVDHACPNGGKDCEASSSGRVDRVDKKMIKGSLITPGLDEDVIGRMDKVGFHPDGIDSQHIDRRHAAEDQVSHLDHHEPMEWKYGALPASCPGFCECSVHKNSFDQFSCYTSETCSMCWSSGSNSQVNGDKSKKVTRSFLGFSLGGKSEVEKESHVDKENKENKDNKDNSINGKTWQDSEKVGMDSKDAERTRSYSAPDLVGHVTGSNSHLDKYSKLVVSRTDKPIDSMRMDVEMVKTPGMENVNKNKEMPSADFDISGLAPVLAPVIDFKNSQIKDGDRVGKHLTRSTETGGMDSHELTGKGAIFDASHAGIEMNSVRTSLDNDKMETVKSVEDVPSRNLARSQESVTVESRPHDGLDLNMADSVIEPFGNDYGPFWTRAEKVKTGDVREDIVDDMREREYDDSVRDNVLEPSEETIKWQ